MRVTAWLNLRTHTGERATIVERGCAAIGYQSLHGITMNPKPGDVFITWNRIGNANNVADRFIQSGNKVIVMENSYLGNEICGEKFYAMSLSHHNGAGSWPAGGDHRWERLGIELKPFRKSGEEIVILPQRGIGEPGVRMPLGFVQSAAARLASFRMKVRERPHPGKYVERAPTLDSDLRDAHAVATWGSSAAIHALRLGIPVIAFWDRWIGAGAARMIDEIGRGLLRDEEARLKMFQRLAWAVWSWDEIESGKAFAHLIRTNEQ